ncbi:hypothetical protein [Clostridium manihotivorum]|uniref:Uncharacterized protein n=1 Tax=Clostridium manihotivorum TaxID=2320868 RepID=A0A3R5TE23_9CLOT|nr:hypothetical protein [Clostridium manihotivorum]QAA31253.1 hypothetical protein C1I91_06105 [Clostridium manihotivorum]
MSDSCNNCRQATLIDALKDDFNKLKDELEDVKKDLTALSVAQGKTEEQTKMVFKILNEIKDSIQLIANKIEDIEKKPGQNWENLIKTVITVIATAAVTFFISKK